jgi:hypothetical protein
MSWFEDLTRFQKIKLIIISAAFIFNLISVIFAFQLSLNNFSLLVDFSRFIPYMRYVELLGMFLFLGVIIIHYLEIKPLNKDIEKKEMEIHLLKSRLYDLEENEKKREKDKNQNHPAN